MKLCAFTSDDAAKQKKKKKVTAHDYGTVQPQVYFTLKTALHFSCFLKAQTVSHVKPALSHSHSNLFPTQIMLNHLNS